MEEFPYRIAIPPTFPFSFVSANTFIFVYVEVYKHAVQLTFNATFQTGSYVLCECIIHKQKPLLFTAATIRLPFCIQGDSRLTEIIVGLSVYRMIRD